jgi:hypothetical protein
MAESSYPDELAAWIEKRAAKKRRQDAAAVAFLAVRGDVKAAMDSGYAVTTIYEHMRETGRVKCSYETFRKHVQRFIKAAPAAPAPVPPRRPTRPRGRSATGRGVEGEEAEGTRAEETRAGGIAASLQPETE